MGGWVKEGCACVGRKVEWRVNSLIALPPTLLFCYFYFFLFFGFSICLCFCREIEAKLPLFLPLVQTLLYFYPVYISLCGGCSAVNIIYNWNL